MKKQIIFLSAFLIVASNCLADSYTEAITANYQTQTQTSISLYEDVNINFQSQSQIGKSESSYGSFATDYQMEGQEVNGTTVVAEGSGVAYNGSYSYFNRQEVININIVMPTVDGSYNEMNGTVGLLGAMTRSTGTAESMAGGVVSNGEWTLTNESHSNVNPTAINVGGFINTNIEHH